MLGLPLFGFWKAVAHVLGSFRGLAMQESRAKPSDSAAMWRIGRVWMYARIYQDREERFAFKTMRLCKSKAAPPWFEDRHNKITAF